MTERRRVAALVGATAIGKTELSIRLAERLDAEVVSMDSMQAYRGMDIGTAKPSEQIRQRVRHHLVDVFDPDEDVSVARFQSLARAAVDDIAARGVLPLLVGGSGLYFRAVVDDLRFPPRSPETRALLEQEADEVGPEILHARLNEVDPEAAAKIESRNTRRIVRALEVVEITGRPFSDNDTWERYESRYDLAAAGLELDRSLLYERIAARVDRMLDEGLEDEARALAEKGLSRTARQALGYRQILDLPPGTSRDEIRHAIVRATKRFARRQESWFRADPRIRWFDAADPELAASVAGFFARAPA